MSDRDTLSPYEADNSSTGSGFAVISLIYATLTKYI